MQPFSGLYKEMCEKAWKALSLEWKPQEGDWYCHKGDWQNEPAESVTKNNKTNFIKENSVWLPVDDDLLFRSLIHLLKFNLLVQLRKAQLKKFMKNNEEEVESKLKDDMEKKDLRHMLSLMFTVKMKSRGRKIWDFNRHEWM